MHYHILMWSYTIVAGFTLIIMTGCDKMDWFNQYAGIMAGVGGLFASIIGGYDYLIRCMFTLMVFDIVCGIFSCVVFGKSKKSTGGISSEILLQGATRKISAIFVVCVAVVVDKTLGMDYVRNTSVLYFIGTEAISILEHIATMGVPLPEFLMKVLEVMKNKGNGGEF